MTYGTASITGSATPAVDLRTAIEALMTAQGNWAFVEGYSASTNSVRVWRCKATNSFGTQWYMALIVNSSSPLYLEMKPFEDYVTASKTAYRGVCGSSSLDVASGSAFGNTGYPPESASWPVMSTLITSTSTFAYRVRVTANGIMVNTSSSTAPTYAGLFNKIWAHANEFPLIKWYLASSTYAFIRRPGVLSGSGFNWDAQAFSSASGFDGSFGSPGTTDAMCGSDMYAARIAVRNNGAVAGVPELTRGYLDTDFVMFSKSDATVSVGDTMTIGGAPYVCIYDIGTNGTLWMRAD